MFSFFKLPPIIFLPRNFVRYFDRRRVAAASYQSKPSFLYPSLCFALRHRRLHRVGSLLVESGFARSRRLRPRRRPAGVGGRRGGSAALGLATLRIPGRSRIILASPFLPPLLAPLVRRSVPRRAVGAASGRLREARPPAGSAVAAGGGPRRRRVARVGICRRKRSEIRRIHRANSEKGMNLVRPCFLQLRRRREPAIGTRSSGRGHG